MFDFLRFFYKKQKREMGFFVHDNNHSTWMCLSFFLSSFLYLFFVDFGPTFSLFFCRAGRWWQSCYGHPTIRKLMFLISIFFFYFFFFIVRICCYRSNCIASPFVLLLKKRRQIHTYIWDKGIPRWKATSSNSPTIKYQF